MRDQREERLLRLTGKDADKKMVHKEIEESEARKASKLELYNKQKRRSDECVDTLFRKGDFVPDTTTT